MRLWFFSPPLPASTAAKQIQQLAKWGERETERAPEQVREGTEERKSYVCVWGGGGLVGVGVCTVFS